jgi:ParB-like nuclease domain
MGAGMNKHITIKCRGADTVSIQELQAFQGQLKKVNRDNIERLKKRIIEDGWTAPVFIWEHDGDKYILDGHQRRMAAVELITEGYIIPPIPVDYIEADNEKDARKKLLSIASQYGEWQKEELDMWVEEVGQSVADTLRLVDSELNLDIVESKKAQKTNIEPYSEVHVLLSFSPSVYADLQNKLEEIRAIPGVEYEQSAN